jgi:cell division septation protein DedD
VPVDIVPLDAPLPPCPPAPPCPPPFSSSSVPPMTPVHAPTASEVMRRTAEERSAFWRLRIGAMVRRVRAEVPHRNARLRGGSRLGPDERVNAAILFRPDARREARALVGCAA